MSHVDTQHLETQVKDMYRRVATEPHAAFHFEMGREMALRLGYRADDLDRVPAGAVDSFAGVGYHFDLAGLRQGERVLDLGSGSGMDTFVAALAVGSEGLVAGVDMTEEQRAKAERLRAQAGFGSVSYHDARIEEVPFADESFDAVISNGVINLAVDKGRVFREAARVLAPGGRLAISDIVSAVNLPESVVCNASLWAACIGGALERVHYQELVESAGLRILCVKRNVDYHFISGRAQGAAGKWGVESISLLAQKS